MIFEVHTAAARQPVDLGAIGFVAIVGQVNEVDLFLQRYLERFGAHEVTRVEFLTRLRAVLDQPTRRGRWAFELDLDAWAERGGAWPADAGGGAAARDGDER